MSPKTVSLQVVLVKRNNFHHRYQVPFAGRLVYNLPPFSHLACQLVAAVHQNHLSLISCNATFTMAPLTDDADYDAGQTFCRCTQPMVQCWKSRKL
ncbi:unnamed protein product [Protopolystoma xenopodis]|uniref:Uncharacterized protein n=1 Tax=Protopolystoma xenopodis TaxID=117903 RepID=A0A448XIQ4_9PLAT|nr:unnamed protein product [Protopolystoma xenopodis]